jgi:hypothetical protein
MTRAAPSLYPRSLFQVLDAREPEDWISHYGEDGERYAYPAPLNAPGFFEDFFDDKSRAVSTFWRVVNRRLAAFGAVVAFSQEGGMEGHKLVVGNDPPTVQARCFARRMDENANQPPPK